jgi:hypothetical protein
MMWSFVICLTSRSYIVLRGKTYTIFVRKDCPHTLQVLFMGGAAQRQADGRSDGRGRGASARQFQTIILNIADQQYLDTFNVLNPNFSFGGRVIYFGPLGGPLFQSNVQILPNNTPVTVTIPH